MTALSTKHQEPWRARLYLPNYQIGEAARYAHIHASTVAAWHRIESKTLSAKEKGSALSYIQLIEVAVVAAFRRKNIKLPRIRAARRYIQDKLGVAYPFAHYTFKKEGPHLLLDYEAVEGKSGAGKHLIADEGGQLEWSEFIEPLLEDFDYEDDGFVLRWFVEGRSPHPIIIDPRLSFGAPTIRGTPTWIIAGRWNAGETPSSIADDFSLELDDVKKALDFERLSASKRGKPSRILH